MTTDLNQHPLNTITEPSSIPPENAAHAPELPPEPTPVVPPATSFVENDGSSDPLPDSPAPVTTASVAPHPASAYEQTIAEPVHEELVIAKPLTEEPVTEESVTEESVIAKPAAEDLTIADPVSEELPAVLAEDHAVEVIAEQLPVVTKRQPKRL